MGDVSEISQPSASSIKLILVCAVVLLIGFIASRFAYQSPRFKDDSAVKKFLQERIQHTIGVDRFGAAQAIVVDELALNWHQVSAGTSDRALALVFSGKNQVALDNMTRVIADLLAAEKAPSNGAEQGSADELRLGCGSPVKWDAMRAAVHTQLRSSPRSLVVLRCADQAPQAALRTIEDALENKELQVDGGQPPADCTRAVFVLHVPSAAGDPDVVVAAAAAGLACAGGRTCRIERCALQASAKKALQPLWHRAALAGRMRIIVPFI